MRALIIAVGLSLLAACATAPPGTTLPPAPVEVANQTKLDEQVGIAVTTAYTATAKAAGLAIEAGLIKDPATIKRIGQLDTAAYSAVMAVRSAYDAANSPSYLAALVRANMAVREFFNAVAAARRTSEVTTVPPSALTVDHDAARAIAALPAS